MTSAIAMFAFGAITALLSLQYPVGSLRMPGSGFLPLALGVMLMGLAAVQFTQARLARPKPAEPAKTPGDEPGRRVLFFMGAVAAATALLRPLGFALMGFVLMFVLLRILGERRWMVSAVIALASAGASQLVFVTWLKIPLPAGMFGF